MVVGALNTLGANHILLLPARPIRFNLTLSGLLTTRISPKVISIGSKECSRRPTTCGARRTESCVTATNGTQTTRPFRESWRSVLVTTWWSTVVRRHGWTFTRKTRFTFIQMMVTHQQILHSYKQISVRSIPTST